MKKLKDAYLQDVGQGEELKPFDISARYLALKGVQGYNPLEKAGNYMYGDKNRRFTKDRMQQYKEVGDILRNESALMGALSSYISEYEKTN